MEYKIRLLRDFYITVRERKENHYEQVFMYDFTFGHSDMKIFRNGIMSRNRLDKKELRNISMQGVGKFLTSYGNHLLRINKKLNIKDKK